MTQNVGNSRGFVVAAIASLYILCLSGTPFSFYVGGVNTSFLEIVSVLLFSFAFISRGARKSPLWIGFLVVVATTIVPLLVGMADFGLKRALRDYSQVLYLGFIFLGGYTYRKGYLTPELIVKTVCWVSVLYSSVFIINNALFDYEVVSKFQYFFRLSVAFSMVFLFARLIGVQGGANFNHFTALVFLLILTVFVIEIRTRALLLMLLLSFSVIVVGSILVRRRKREISSLYVLVLVGVLFFLTPLADALIGIELAAESSVARLLALWRGEVHQDLTAFYRIEAWSRAYDAFLARPVFGNGFGKYILLDPWLRGEHRLYPPTMIHNTYLQILYVGGVIHLFGYLYFFYSALGPNRSRARSAELVENDGSARMAKAFFIGFLLYSFFGVTFFKVTDAIFVWFIVGYFSQVGVSMAQSPIRRVPLGTVAGAHS